MIFLEFALLANFLLKKQKEEGIRIIDQLSGGVVIALILRPDDLSEVCLLFDLWPSPSPPDGLASQ